MKTFVGIDIAKEVHWVCAIDFQGTVLLNRAFDWVRSPSPAPDNSPDFRVVFSVLVEGAHDGESWVGTIFDPRAKLGVDTLQITTQAPGAPIRRVRVERR